MPVSVAMYAKTYDAIKPQLDNVLAAEGIDDVDVWPFDLDGTYLTPNGRMQPEDVDLDYLWLSPELSLDGVVGKAFRVALRTRSIGVLQTFNAGLDNPAYKEIAAKGTRICNSSAQAIAISEYVLGQVFAMFQPIEEQRRLQAAKTWRRTPFREIAGTNWLIVGFGPIGREIAQRAKALGATVTVVRRTPETRPSVDRAGTTDELDDLLPAADVIVLACPLNAATRGLADSRFFGAIKQGAVLVNIARGGLIIDEALIAALDSGRLASAVLDVFHEEPLPAGDALWTHPKVRLTAHTSFSGSGVRQRWAGLFLDNLPRFVRGEALINEVDPADLT